MQTRLVHAAITNPCEAETRFPPETNLSGPAPIDIQEAVDGAGPGSISEQASHSSDGDIPAFLHTESGSATEDLAEQIGDYIGGMKRDHPEMFQSAGGGDVLSDWMTGKMSEETEEQKKKFLQLLATAKDPDSVLLAITQRHAEESLTKVGKLMTAYKDQMETLDHLQASLDLHGATGELTQAGMMKTNMEFSRAQSDTMNLFQVIQKEMNNYENVMQSGQSMFKANNADDIMIQNMKS